MHKEGNEQCIIYTLIYWSVLITFTVRVIKQSCQYKISKKTIIEAQSVLESKYNIGTRVLSQDKIFALVRVRVIKVLVPIFYSAIKHRYPCFIS